MKKLISNLQEKSYETRRTILISATAACALIVVSLWVLTIKSEPHNPIAASKKTTPTQKISSYGENFEEFGAQIKNTWGDIETEWNGFSSRMRAISSSTNSTSN